MKWCALLLLLASSVLVVDAFWSKKGQGKSKKTGFNKRGCEHVCNSFARHLDGKIFFKKWMAFDSSPENVMKEFERFCYLRRPICDPFSKVIESKLEAFNDAVKERKSVIEVCDSAAVCDNSGRSLSKQNVRGRWNGVKACKICRTVTKLLSEAIEQGNDTIAAAKKLALMVCSEYVEDKSMKDKCLKIVNGIFKMEKVLAGKVEHMHLCKGIGLCGNDTQELKKACLDGFKPPSVWDTARQVVRNVPGIFSIGSKLRGAIYHAVKNTFWSQMEECLSVVNNRMKDSKIRAVRSVDEPRCEMCDKMSTSAKKLATGSGFDGLTRHLDSLCYKVNSRRSGRICTVIRSFTNASKSMVDSVMPSDLCRGIACYKPDKVEQNHWTDKKQCELCRTISTYVMKNIEELGHAVGYIIEMVDDICGDFSEKESVQECHNITKMLNRILMDMQKQFTDNNLCKEIGVCPETPE